MRARPLPVTLFHIDLPSTVAAARHRCSTRRLIAAAPFLLRSLAPQRITQRDVLSLQSPDLLVLLGPRALKLCILDLQATDVLGEDFRVLGPELPSRRPAEMHSCRRRWSQGT
jgi:hypothetical protein